MKATIVQCGLKWEERDANLAHISSLLDAARSRQRNSGAARDVHHWLHNESCTSCRGHGRPDGQVDEGTGRCNGGYALCGSVIIGEEEPVL
jgi:hypothetical protein